jgi:plasmid stabilization system protein ParE
VKVRFTPSGRLQFLTVLAYVRGDNPDAARKLRLRAEKILRRLGRYPKSGRLIPEFPELPYREVLIPPYRFFYRVEGKTVWVVAVWHGAQLPEEPIVK